MGIVWLEFVDTGGCMKAAFKVDDGRINIQQVAEFWHLDAHSISANDIVLGSDQLGYSLFTMEDLHNCTEGQLGTKDSPIRITGAPGQRWQKHGNRPESKTRKAQNPEGKDEDIGSIISDSMDLNEVVPNEFLDEGLAPSSQPDLPGQEQAANSLSSHEAQAEVNTQNTRSITKDLWPMNTLEALIDDYEKMKVSHGVLKRSHWSEIADNVNQKYGTTYNYKQCKNKMELMIKTYRRKKMKASQTGYAPSSWKFYSRMDQILADNPKARGASGGLAYTGGRDRDVLCNAFTSSSMQQDDGSDDLIPSSGADEQAHRQNIFMPNPLSCFLEHTSGEPMKTSALVTKKSKFRRESMGTTVNTLIGGLNNCTRAFERCTQMEVEANARISQEAKAFQLEIARMQLEITRELTVLLGKRKR